MPICHCRATRGRCRASAVAAPKQPDRQNNAQPPFRSGDPEVDRVLVVEAARNGLVLKVDEAGQAGVPDNECDFDYAEGDTGPEQRAAAPTPRLKQQADEKPAGDEIV